ncbi:putative NRPS-like protein biosynthetic cluster [Cryomyces antarcticus]|uniref:NRPS-like protein biosynthetic cluster n=1 Tax=Cryomyces antarcticus TaxID=329879 RepID=A0ABR0LQV1_9PEZI|nr:hypothetical protein LTR39_000463 [Cryomyces antarcticus]KAK5020677.1 hypothetical protein LTR60_000307 [Cryomyces antarcticus]KAK5202014.1 putative NRPS-like protein biosynthetic cluster [Cryomyces antarcticus]
MLDIHTKGLGNGTKGSSASEPLPVGERTLPELADELALSDPSRIWATIARASDVSDGFLDVTVKELANAVSATAWWIEEKIGRSDEFATIAYQGASDIRYAIFWFAAIKCGYKLLVPSVRNSVSGNVSLMEQTQCTKFFYSKETAPNARKLREEMPNLESFEVPTLKEMLSGPSEHYFYSKDWTEAKDEPVIICHTSGSTGSYKPIVLDHMYFAIYDNQRKLPLIEGRQNLSYANFDFHGGGKFYSAFPPFHVAGIVSITVVPLFFDATVVYGPVDTPASGEIASKIMRCLNIRALFTPPTILEEFMQEPGSLGQAATLDFALFAGGPLAPSCGDIVIQATEVYQFTGSTEIGIVPTLTPKPRENWNYFEWHPVYECKVESIDGKTFELVIPRNDSLDWIRGRCFPDRLAPEWRTKDTYRRHPANRDIWRFHGRTDDIIVLSNGEKFSPVSQEGIIQGHSLLSGALLTGQARAQAALLVELRKGVTLSHAEVVEQIWPTVEKANSLAPAHARIFRSKILVTSPETPFERVGKGTVKRKETLALYAARFDALYDGGKNGATIGDLPAVDNIDDLASIRRFLQAHFKEALRTDVATEDTDFFDLGLNSVQTIELAGGIRAAFEPQVNGQTSVKSISPKTIYAHPTIDSLSVYLHSLARPNGNSGIRGNTARSNVEGRTQRMKHLVEKYAKDLPSKAVFPLDADLQIGHGQAKRPVTVILTGTTGTLGIWLLHALLSDQKVPKVYCLDRSADARERNLKGFAERHFPVSPLFDGTKCEFLQVSFGHPHFGLDTEQFTELLQKVDVVIHNAWAVNFNHSLESFEAVHIRGVRNFINFSLGSLRKPRIYFVSSISSVGNWAAVHGFHVPVPAQGLDRNNYDVAQVDLGYGESKHVSERILERASQSGVPVSILRVGQIAGPLAVDGGCWTKHEWLPSLVRTSKALGRIPAELGLVDWIPVDKLANTIKDLVFANIEKASLEVYNLVNPRVSSWSDLVPAVQNFYKELHSSSPAMKTIPLDKWVEALERIDLNNRDAVDEMPSIKILDFYKAIGESLSTSPISNIAAFDTDNLSRESDTMRNLRSIDRETVTIWLRQWDF